MAKQVPQKTEGDTKEKVVRLALDNPGLFDSRLSLLMFIEKVERL